QHLYFTTKSDANTLPYKIFFAVYLSPYFYFMFNKHNTSEIITCFLAPYSANLPQPCLVN
ncbi:hypothetical protein, partial [Salmonella enterica]|uniref:hypothetical protein n=1 Tax=Salmonella enterica TaxID=28901 RepID=UPI003FA6F25C